MELKLYNTLTRSKEVFRPIDPDNVRMYVCGPTVYDHAHIGNARPVIVFDVLFRLLRHLASQGVWDGGKGQTEVTYVRNITDVDDKINARAARDFPELPLNEAIRKVTEATNAGFQADVKALGCLEPTSQPRATEHIDGMRAMIDRLVSQGVAYVAEGHVLFSPSAMNARRGPRYGALSRRPFDEMLAGARVDVASYKRDEMDFVLWKPSKEGEPGWPSPAGIEGLGRPGWHIECSAMSMAKLLEPFGGGLVCDDPMKNVFDIHGGGIDLVFPHHENEIAQSCCALGTERMANIWMHNGFLQVEGRKMSKSEGNFVTINELLRRNLGDAVRWLLLKTHYRQPMDFTDLGLMKSAQELRKLYEAAFILDRERNGVRIDESFEASLLDDLDIPGAIKRLHELASSDDRQDRVKLRLSLELLGMKHIEEKQLLNRAIAFWGNVPNEVATLGMEYRFLLANALHEHADQIAAAANDLGWRLSLRGSHVDFEEIGAVGPSLEVRVHEAISKRLALIREKNWAEADRIRDELLAQGIQLKDGKDPATGERTTTWEVKR